MSPVLFSEIEKEVGIIDLYIHDLGAGNLSVVSEQDDDKQIAQQLHDNLACATDTAAYLRSAFSKRSSGRVIYLVPWSWDRHACPTRFETVKGGTLALTKAMAKKMAPAGVTVNCVIPGYIRGIRPFTLETELGSSLTETIPMGYLGEIRDVSNAVLYFASESAKYATGQVIDLCGGLDYA